MPGKSKIEWTNRTWNPIAGCSRVSSGCDHCYAMRQAKRIQAMGNTDAYNGTTRHTKRGVDWTGQVNLLPERLDQPLRWAKPSMIFVNSMSDLFHPAVPFDFVDRVFAVMALAQQHTFQILTKRPERMAAYLNDVRPDYLMRLAANMVKLWDGKGSGGDRAVAMRTGEGWPLPNVWLGTSVEDQDAADERIPHLLRCPAAVRWLSCEPLLGPVDLCEVWMPDGDALGQGLYNYGTDSGLGWVVVGGESGPGARPMVAEWARLIRRQCDRAGVPFFMKQGSSNNWPAYKDFDSFPEDLRVREYPHDVVAA